MVQIYVIRHGQVPANNKNIISGNSPEELTSIGVKQSEEARDKLKNISFDAIFCSNVRRTIQTAEILNTKAQEIIFDERISEREAGSLLGKSRTEIKWETWNSLELDRTPEGAETLGAILKRVKNFLNEITEKYQGKKILIVTHSSVAKCVWAVINDITDKSKLDAFVQDNCEIREYSI